MSPLKYSVVLAFPFLRPYNDHKLQNRSSECVFLGFSSYHKGYLCLNRQTGRIYVSCHVIFHETSFPFSSSLPTSFSPNPSIVPLLSVPPLSTPSSFPISHTPSPSPTLSPSPTSSPPPTSPSPLSLRLSFSDGPPSPQLENMHNNAHTSEVSIFSSFTPSGPVIHRPPYETNVHSMTTRSKAGVHKPKLFTAAIDNAPDLKLYEPATYKQASAFPQWQQAMLHEFKTLQRNHTWTLVPPSPSMKVIGCKLVYRLKLRPDGSV